MAVILVGLALFGVRRGPGASASALGAASRPSLEGVMIIGAHGTMRTAGHRLASRGRQSRPRNCL